MGAYTRGTLTAIAYRGDTLEVTELGLERGIRYVIKGVRGVTGAAGQQPADRRGKRQALTGRPLRFGSRLFCAMQHDVVVQLIAPLHAPLRAAGSRAQQPATAAPWEALCPAMAAMTRHRGCSRRRLTGL